MPATPEEVAIANWMFDEYQKSERLHQSQAAMYIINHFGQQHVHHNANGNWAINKPILETFRKLTPDDTVWSRSDQLWRKRQPYDKPGRRMVD